MAHFSLLNCEEMNEVTILMRTSNNPIKKCQPRMGNTWTFNDYIYLATNLVEH